MHWMGSRDMEMTFTDESENTCEMGGNGAFEGSYVLSSITAGIGVYSSSYTELGSCKFGDQSSTE